MNIETISRNAMHYWPLFFARENPIKKTEKKEEKYRVNPVEKVLGSPANRKIKREGLGNLINFYA